MKDNKCSNCKFWRCTASFDNDEGDGKCENEKTMIQVSMITENQLLRFVHPSEARMIANSMRFSSEFSCINFEIK